MDLFVHIPVLFSALFLLLTFSTYTHVQAGDELPKRRNHLNGIRRLQATHSSEQLIPTNIHESFRSFSDGSETNIESSSNPIASGSFNQNLLNALERAYEFSLKNNLTKIFINHEETIDEDASQRDRWRKNGQFVRRINFLRNKIMPHDQKANSIETEKLRESLRRKLIAYLNGNINVRSQAPHLTDNTFGNNLSDHPRSTKVKLRAKSQKIADSTPSNSDSVVIEAIGKDHSSADKLPTNGVMNAIRNQQHGIQAASNLLNDRWNQYELFSISSPSDSIEPQGTWPISSNSIRRSSFSRHTTSTTSPDYHYRSVVPMKKFKFTRKHSHHPRLRIRRPGESFVFRGNQVVSNLRPIDLPSLTPLNPDSSSTYFKDNYNGQKNIIEEAKENSKSNNININEDETATKELNTYRSYHFESPQVDRATEIPKNSGLRSALPPKEFRDGFGSADIDQNQAIISPDEFNSGFGINIPENSGLRPVAPPKEFQDGFGSNQASGSAPPEFEGSISGASKGSGELVRQEKQTPLTESNYPGEFFTGDSALTPNRNGPTGDGYGPPIFPGAAAPPPVPAVSIGGSAAGIRPYWLSDSTPNPPPTLKPSALFNILQKADMGFNQALTHFEQGTPIEAAAIDILEVALGSQKLDSQAKLLGHIDRAIGLDNLQRFQRWANTGGALDALKEQIVKLAKNYSPPENLIPTIPPQLQYLFSPSGKR